MIPVSRERRERGQSIYTCVLVRRDFDPNLRIFPQMTLYDMHYTGGVQHIGGSIGWNSQVYAHLIARLSLPPISMFLLIPHGF